MRPIVAMVLLAVALFPAGCGRTKKDPDPAPVAQGDVKKLAPKSETPKSEPPKSEPAKSDAPAERFKKPQAGAITRRYEATDLRNVLHNLGIAYTAFTLEHNQGPKSREELESYYERNAKINQLLKDGDIIVVWKAIRPEEPSKTVLAYENEVDSVGQRMVLTYDGIPTLMPDAEFQKMPKARQRK